MKEFNNPLSKSGCLNAVPGLELKRLEALQDSVILCFAANKEMMVMGYQEGSLAKKRGFVIPSRGRKSGEHRKRTDVFGGGEKLYPCSLFLQRSQQKELDTKQK